MYFLISQGVHAVVQYSPFPLLLPSILAFSPFPGFSEQRVRGVAAKGWLLAHPCISKAASSHLTFEVVFPPGKDLTPFPPARSREMLLTQRACALTQSQPSGWSLPLTLWLPQWEVRWNTRGGAFGELTLVFEKSFSNIPRYLTTFPNILIENTYTPRSPESLQ